MSQHVFIIGCKGIPSNYGGFETFVDKLTEYNEKLEQGIMYHVACMGDENKKYSYHGAECFTVKVPHIGPARAPLYDIYAIKQVLKYLKAHPEIQNPIVYVLACRIGPFIRPFVKGIHKLGGCFYLNPDGHEWMRSKWSPLVRKYWKWSEKLMVKHSDLCICDSKNIETYIRDSYSKYKPKTTYIAYGADTESSSNTNLDVSKELDKWLWEHDLARNDYYLIVGRFVPENNYETVLREFMASHTKKKLAIITTENPKLQKQLNERLHYEIDPRIYFVGTVYNQSLLVAIRENAFGYFHGHEVGGTNPSLLEALRFTKLNLVLDVGFNREVVENAGKYWTKEIGNLSSLIDQCDLISEDEINNLSVAAKRRIKDEYTWEYISNLYKNTFLTK